MRSLTPSTAPVACPAPFNMARYVLAAGQATPDKIALHILRTSGAERWSYARLSAAVRGVGTGLLAQGLSPGDRVLMRLGNSVDFPLTYLGAIAAGLIPVPTPATLTMPEVTSLAHGLQPALIVAGDGIALPQDDSIPTLRAADLVAMRDMPPCDWDMGADGQGNPDRLAYIIYTSGTSGVARAVMHAHRAVWARRMMWDGWYGLRPDDRLLHAGAFNWTYTLGTGLMDPWAIGATALIPSDTATLALMLRRFDATLFAAAPGVFRQMLRGADALPLPHLRHALSAGEKLPDVTRDAWVAATGRPVYEALGMSECSTFVSAAPDRPVPPGASGYAQPGRRIAVLGPDHAPLPHGQTGTLAIHRSDPGLFLGYRNAAEATAACFAGDWFLTGDSVMLAQDGAVHYMGRDDDMMNAGGFRVSPIEVERVLNTHPAILECACAEVQVKPGTSVIAAFYVATDPGGRMADTPGGSASCGPASSEPASGGPAPFAPPGSPAAARPAPAPYAGQTPPADPTTDPDDLARFAAQNLARYKQPRLFVPVTALPRGANNKLLRRVLRQEWEAAHGQA
ncbi:class I adenylate-forming enzyme family protein [Roseicitreum antarcticum]|uniref:Acyl-CoA synthetase (AMP-forming)/AMP-acid ligase II n=1 Tax=Roseicitreum antarcticum TaxID=564137 RepID=A0A1H3CHB3_9RHOB|nr:class I adenylate-forming enzyme family protein [Roseicitreum antarcticum]SDX53602.1 Acyl-CoA synthetase (AMP-forming)/AMP-acid ligase II [Roseicitreum antarcticum]